MPRLDGAPVETDGRTIWRLFAENYYLFRGTPTRLWFDYVLQSLFGIDEPLDRRHRRRALRPDRRAAWPRTPSARARCSSASTSR